MRRVDLGPLLENDNTVATIGFGVYHWAGAWDANENNTLFVALWYSPCSNGEGAEYEGVGVGTSAGVAVVKMLRWWNNIHKV